MTLFKRFPYLQDVLDADASALEIRFHAVCAAAGVDPGSKEAEPIAIDIIADVAGNQLVTSNRQNP